MGNRILLADDSITIQKVVNLTFADEGIEVVSVSNGDMAERRLNEVNPDLVLADIFMPGKNGYELCEAIKQNPQFRNVPVVLLVGAFEPFDQAEARRVRADAHLTKPFESRTLVETVRKLISTTDQARPESNSPAPSADRKGGRQPEDRAFGSIVQPPLKPDFSAMTDQSAMPATVEAPDRSFEMAANENAPVAQGQSAEDYVESLQPLDIHLSPEPYQEQPDLSSASAWTKEPSVMTSEDHPSDPFDLTPLEVSAHDAADAPSVDLPSMVGVETADAPDLMASFENIDLEPLETETPTLFGVDDQEAILDLERPEAVYTYEAENGESVDLASGRGFNFTTGGLQGENARAASSADSDAFKTQMLEPPPGLSHSEERINTNPLDTSFASDFNRPSAAPVGLAELYEAETSSSTLLAVDDPLGDVLMFEQEMDVLSYEAQQSPQTLFGEQPANEVFSLEFNPQEPQVFDVPGLTATEARVTGELTEPVASNAEEAAEPYAPREAAAEAQPQASNEHAEANSSFESSSAATSEATESDESSQPAESGFEFRSEFETPIPQAVFGQSENRFNASEEMAGEDRASAPGVEFTSSEMWDEQEARFAAIDIEATPVDESAPEPGASERASVETGFEFAPAMEEGSANLSDMPVVDEPLVDERLAADQSVANASVAGAPDAQASSGLESHPSEAAAETTAETIAESAQVSPALIDEIARRVVSLMSESVVREIAWEVVPDVVERVIKEMARAEASKRN